MAPGRCKKLVCLQRTIAALLLISTHHYGPISPGMTTEQEPKPHSCCPAHNLTTTSETQQGHEPAMMQQQGVGTDSGQAPGNAKSPENAKGTRGENHMLVHPCDVPGMVNTNPVGLRIRRHSYFLNSWEFFNNPSVTQHSASPTGMRCAG